MTTGVTGAAVEVTRLGVRLYDYIDTSKYQDKKDVLQEGSKKEKPSSSAVEEMEDCFALGPGPGCRI